MFFWVCWTKVEGSGSRRPESTGIGLYELQSLAGQSQLKSRMPGPHYAKHASAGDSNRKTAPSPPLPLPQSPGNCPPENERKKFL
jgi:hypothetical protein